MAVAAITPAGLLMRNLALTTRGSAQPYQEDPGRSTQLITAVPGSRPATAGNHPQHRCGLLRECLCSTGPGTAPQQGRGTQKPEWGSQPPPPQGVRRFLPKMGGGGAVAKWRPPQLPRGEGGD